MSGLVRLNGLSTIASCGSNKADKARRKECNTTENVEPQNNTYSSIWIYVCYINQANQELYSCNFLINHNLKIWFKQQQFTLLAIIAGSKQIKHNILWLREYNSNSLSSTSQYLRGMVIANCTSLSPSIFWKLLKFSPFLLSVPSSAFYVIYVICACNKSYIAAAFKFLSLQGAHYVALWRVASDIISSYRYQLLCSSLMGYFSIQPKWSYTSLRNHNAWQ